MAKKKVSLGNKAKKKVSLGNKAKKSAQACPRCGSEDTVLRLNVHNQRWRCNECKAPFRVKAA